jgi:hypothetical protein
LTILNAFDGMANTFLISNARSILLESHDSAGGASSKVTILTRILDAEQNIPQPIVPTPFPSTLTRVSVFRSSGGLRSVPSKIHGCRFALIERAFSDFTETV